MTGAILLVAKGKESFPDYRDLTEERHILDVDKILHVTSPEDIQIAQMILTTWGVQEIDAYVVDYFPETDDIHFRNHKVRLS